MFNVEPIEPWTEAEREEFERYVAVRHRTTVRSAGWAGLVLLILGLCTIPFLDGQPLHGHWNLGRDLLFPTLIAFIWFVYKAALIYASWQSARETRREMEP